jgi:WD40 repeat protein
LKRMVVWLILSRRIIIYYLTWTSLTLLEWTYYYLDFYLLLDIYYFSHEGPVWQISWSHPKFGSLLASCGYDSKVFIWKQSGNTWGVVKEFDGHTASGTIYYMFNSLVNSVAWAPHEYGLVLACASSDGKISILTYQGTKQMITFLIIQKTELGELKHSRLMQLVWMLYHGVPQSHLVPSSQHKHLHLFNQLYPKESYLVDVII